MKTEAISKINKMGKVGTILTRIGKIVIGIGIVATLIVTILFASIPKDFITMKLSGNAVIQVDLNTIHSAMTKERTEDLLSSTADMESSVTFNDSSYRIEEFSINDSVITLQGSGDIKSISIKQFAFLFASTMLYLIMTFVSLIFIGKLCKSFQNCESPFEDDVIKKLQNFAYSLIPWALFSTISDSVSSGFYSGNYNFSINFGIILIVLVILALAYIFKYGAVLQQESDETL